MHSRAEAVRLALSSLFVLGRPQVLVSFCTSCLALPAPGMGWSGPEMG